MARRRPNGCLPENAIFSRSLRIKYAQAEPSIGYVTASAPEPAPLHCTSRLQTVGWPLADNTQALIPFMSGLNFKLSSSPRLAPVVSAINTGACRRGQVEALQASNRRLRSSSDSQRTIALFSVRLATACAGDVTFALGVAEQRR
jgi:hypothetical protein